MADKQNVDGRLRELALFAGAGGGILGGQLLGWQTVCAVEISPYPASILIQRQNDRFLPPFPVWDDVCTFSGKPWRGIVDVVSGGFPCQDISKAGKGAGIGGKRSGLWSEMARIIGEVRPHYAFIENSPVLTIRGFDRVLCDLAEMGFDAKWGIVSAAGVGAWHMRERLWCVATHPLRKRKQGKWAEPLSREYRIPGCENVRGLKDLQNRFDVPDPLVRGIRNGIPAYVDRLTALGNAQVPQCAAEAWRILTQ